MNFNRRTPETSVDLLIDNGFSDVAQIRSQVLFRSQFILSQFGAFGVAVPWFIRVDAGRVSPRRSAPKAATSAFATSQALGCPMARRGSTPSNVQQMARYMDQLTHKFP